MPSSDQVKIVFQDIDGCLNPKSGEDFPPGGVGKLSPEQRCMLEEIGQAVEESSLDYVIINTGRNTIDTDFIQKAMKSKKTRYALLEHSAYGYDFMEKKVIALHELAQNYQFQDLENRYLTLEKIKHLIPWYRETGRPYLKSLGIDTGDCLDKEANLSLPIPEGLNGEELLQHLKEAISKSFPEEFTQQLHYCHSNFFADVIGPILKSDGAKLLAHHFGIPHSQCAFIGDSLNDMDLFEAYPGKGFCPANAHPKIKVLCQKLNSVESKLPYGLATLDYYKKLKSS